MDGGGKKGRFRELNGLGLVVASMDIERSELWWASGKEGGKVTVGGGDSDVGTSGVVLGLGLELSWLWQMRQVISFNKILEI